MNKHIIFEHLAGRATPLQHAMIEQWLAINDNQEQYYEWLDEWENKNLQFIPNTDAALKKIMYNYLPIHEVQPKPETKFFFLRLLRSRMLAASVFFLLMLTTGYLFRNTILYKTISTQFGEVQSVLLPDGSQVVLNANTTIRYARFGFNKNTRILHLSGEAEFNVVHTKNHQQFIVKTDKQLDVTVLGTQFSVYARQGNATVVLQNGKVELHYTDQQSPKKLVMVPGDKFVAKGATKPQITKVQNPSKLTAWKNHEFLFESTSLAEIGEIIQDNFGFASTFKQPDMAGKTISGSFHAEKLEELLSALSELLGIKYQIKDRTILFY